MMGLGWAKTVGGAVRDRAEWTPATGLRRTLPDSCRLPTLVFCRRCLITCTWESQGSNTVFVSKFPNSFHAQVTAQGDWKYNQCVRCVKEGRSYWNYNQCMCNVKDGRSYWKYNQHMCYLKNGNLATCSRQVHNTLSWTRPRSRSGCKLNKYVLFIGLTFGFLCCWVFCCCCFGGGGGGGG